MGTEGQSEIDARTYRVERIMAELTRPMFVWRMARAKMFSPLPMGKAARTTYPKAIKELDDLLRDTLKKEYGGA